MGSLPRHRGYFLVFSAFYFPRGSLLGVDHVGGRVSAGLVSSGARATTFEQSTEEEGQHGHNDQFRAFVHPGINGGKCVHRLRLRPFLRVSRASSGRSRPRFIFIKNAIGHTQTVVRWRMIDMRTSSAIATLVLLGALV